MWIRQLRRGLHLILYSMFYVHKRYTQYIKLSLIWDLSITTNLKKKKLMKILIFGLKFVTCHFGYKSKTLAITLGSISNGP